MVTPMGILYCALVFLLQPVPILTSDDRPIPPRLTDQNIEGMDRRLGVFAHARPRRPRSLEISPKTSDIAFVAYHCPPELGHRYGAHGTAGDRSIYTESKEFTLPVPDRRRKYRSQADTEHDATNEDKSKTSLSGLEDAQRHPTSPGILPKIKIEHHEERGIANDLSDNTGHKAYNSDYSDSDSSYNDDENKTVSRMRIRPIVRRNQKQRGSRKVGEDTAEPEQTSESELAWYEERVSSEDDAAALIVDDSDEEDSISASTFLQ